MKKPSKSMPYKDLIHEHKKLVHDLEGAKDQYLEQKKELDEYLKEYAKLKGYSIGGNIKKALQHPDKLGEGAKKRKKQGYSDGGNVDDADSKRRNTIKQKKLLIQKAHESGNAEDFVNQSRDLLRMLEEDNKKYDGGQIQESQQKQYQAKDYFGKGSNGPGISAMSSMGGVRMANGGETPDNQEDESNLRRFIKSLKKSLKTPEPKKTVPETRDEKYDRIRQENIKRFSGQISPFIGDEQNYSEGGDVDSDKEKSYEEILGKSVGKNLDPEKVKQFHAFADGGNVRKSMEQRIASPIQVIDPVTGQVKQSITKQYTHSEPSVEENKVQNSEENDENQEQSLEPHNQIIDDMAKDKLKRYLNLVNKVQDKNSNIQVQRRGINQELHDQDDPRSLPKVEDKMIQQISEDIKSNPDKQQEVLRYYENNGIPITTELLDRINESLNLEESKYNTGGIVGGTAPVSPLNASANITSTSLNKRKLVKKYAIGGDVKKEEDMNLGDLPIEVEGLPYDYAAEDQDAQKTADFSNEEQIRKALEEQNNLKSEEEPKSIPSKAKTIPNSPDQADYEKSDSDKEIEKPFRENVKQEDQEKNDNQNLEDSYSDEEKTAEEKANQESFGKELTSEEEPSSQEKPFNAMRAMKEAQDYRNQSQMWNQLGAIAERGASAYARIPTTQQETYKENMAIAQQAVDDTKMKIAMQGYDPNSEMSKMFRQYLQKFSGQSVNPNITVMDGKEILPMVFKDFEAKQAEKNRKELIIEKEKMAQSAAEAKKELVQMQIEQKREQVKEHNDLMKFLGQQKIDSEKEKKVEKKDLKDLDRIDKMNKMITQDIATSRSSFGVAARNRQAIDNAKALLNNQIDYNDLDNRQVVELARVLDRVLSGGQATITGTEHLTPDSAKQWLAKKLEFITSKRRGAGAGSFVETISHTLDREGDIADKQIKDAQKSMLGTLKGVEKNDKDSRSYQAYINMLKSHHLDILLPEDEKESNKKEISTSDKNIIKKGYNSKTNQTQFIYSDGTKEIKDGKL